MTNEELIVIAVGAALIIASGAVMRVLRNKYCPDIAAARVFDDAEISKFRFRF